MFEHYFLVKTLPMGFAKEQTRLVCILSDNTEIPLERFMIFCDLHFSQVISSEYISYSRFTNENPVNYYSLNEKPSNKYGVSIGLT